MLNYNPHDRYNIKLHLQITLLQPMSHISESVGNQTNLRTMKVTDLEGNPSEVFTLSGNALRNRILRRCGIDSFLSQIGVQVSPTMHHALFCGGAIDGGTGNDLDLDKKIRQLLPCLSVLGTAKPKGLFGVGDAQMVHGRVSIGDAYLVCVESAEYIYRQFPPALPLDVISALEQIVDGKDLQHSQRVNQWLGIDTVVNQYDLKELLTEWMPYLGEKLRYYSDWLTYNQKTRRDSLHDPNFAKHLIGAKPQPKIGQGDLFVVDDDNPKKKPEKEKSQQMIMGNWLLQTGATLYSYWSANVTRIEEGFIADALLKFAESPYLGGQSGTGCGLCSMQFWFETANGDRGEFMTITPHAQKLSDRASESHARYKEYLEDYKGFLADSKSDIRSLLNG
ncbi:MAG: hypothetical protein IM566_04625 [Pseudanabaena sp. M152S2SP2A07QC]|nr:hypothetical protein [Pseudanabaena sp. M109S1SP2A07QC]MCA6546710.1 hypothetical protein [Pseudanabaena sp. M152S2SP2A07QC]